MLSSSVNKTIMYLITSLAVIGVTIYCILSPYMRVLVPSNNLYDIVDFSFDKVCINYNSCSSDSKLINESLRSSQTALYALYIILIIFVGIFTILHLLNINIKPLWIPYGLMIMIAIATLITLIVTVKTYSIVNTDAEFSNSSVLMIVILCMLIVKKVYYLF